MQLQIQHLWIIICPISIVNLGAVMEQYLSVLVLFIFALLAVIAAMSILATSFGSAYTEHKFLYVYFGRDFYI